MQKKLILLLFLLFVISCSRLEEGKGALNQITIITSKEDLNIIKPNVEKVFFEYIHTPLEEKLYNIKWVDANNFKDFIEYRNLFFVSVDDPYDSTIDLINKKFIDKYNMDILSLNNLYSKNQKVIVFSSSDIVQFNNQIINYETWIKNEFQVNIDNSINQRIIYNGYNDSISQIINKDFDIDFFVQNDYKVIKSDTFENFLWIGRGFPYRWITLIKFNLNDLKSYDSYWSHYSNLLSFYMPNLKISRHFKNEVYDINGEILYLEGLYEESFSDTGGPFFVKIFKLDEDNFIYLSGFVNNPGKPKYILLKELKLILDKTKSTRRIYE